MINTRGVRITRRWVRSLATLMALCYYQSHMALFLLASLPLLFGLVVLLPWEPRRAPRTIALALTFLKGALIFFPGYLVILLTRRIFGFSYDGLLLYLSLLHQDHLVPLLVALGGFLLLQKKMSFSSSDESIFLTVFAYLAGFFSLLNLADALRTWGGWEAYTLFLLPLLRIGAALLVSLLAQKFFRWEGRNAGLFCGAGAALAFLLTLASFFYSSGRLGWSIVLAVASVCAGVAFFAMRFPRAVRD